MPTQEHDNDAHADDLHDRRLHPNHTHAVVDVELRQRSDAANDTAARASLPLDPWVVEALREEFLDDGAAELGVDVNAVEIVVKSNGMQVDIHACYFSITVCVETYRNACRRKS